MAVRAKKTKSTNKIYYGYIINTYKVIQPQLDYINNLLSEITEEDTKWMFKHILIGQVLDPWKTEIPIYHKLLNSKLPKADFRELLLEDLIDMKDYSDIAGKSRRFWVKPEILDQFIKVGSIDIRVRMKADKFNLFTGKKANTPSSNSKYDSNRNKEPDVISKAMDTIKTCYFNLDEVIAHVEALESRAEILKQNLGEKHPKYLTAKGQYINDRNCLWAVADQKPVQFTEQIWRFRPAYRVQMSGRISHIQGGLQSCSREMKAAAYKGVENLRNYDLKSSQVNGLIQQFELAGLDVSWLIDYRDNGNSKQEYAAQVGISVDTWKDCICSVIFGSYVSPKISKNNKAKLEEKASDSPAVLGYLSKEANGDIAQTAIYLGNFCAAIAPLKSQIDAWHDWLLNTYAKKMSYFAKGEKFIKNAAGKTLNLTKLEALLPEWKLKATIAAFVLQGQEAAFIHELTLLSLRYDYQVIANEHDGLVTLGTIPQEAVDIAAMKSRLQTPTLVEKPICESEIMATLDAELELVA